MRILAEAYPRTAFSGGRVVPWMSEGVATERRDRDTGRCHNLSLSAAPRDTRGDDGAGYEMFRKRLSVGENGSPSLVISSI